MKHELFFVFDCESVGLHGETFAVGYVVVDRDGDERDKGLYVADWRLAGQNATAESILWIKENIPVMEVTHRDLDIIREQFWFRWLYWKERGAVMAADVPWPVEARYLLTCVGASNPFAGPYPLIDIASVVLATGGNPLEALPRNPNELPAHNPLNDARQSARILIEHLKKCS